MAKIFSTYLFYTGINLVMYYLLLFQIVSDFIIIIYYLFALLNIVLRIK